MKIFFGALVAGLTLASTMKASPDKKNPTIEEITRGAFYARPGGVGIRSMADGEHYSMVSNDGKAILRYAYNNPSACDTLFSVARAHDCSIEHIDGYAIGPKGNHILLFENQEYIYRRSWKANVYHYDVRRNRVEPLSDKGGKVMIPTFSPDGKMVAFVRDNNIFIKKFEFNTEVQVTTDGAANKIINGATDWVYEEELEQTNLMSWSPDGTFLGFVRTDESNVPEYQIPFYLGHLYPKMYTYKYPKAGEQNSVVSVHVYNVIDRTVKPVSLPIDKESYIPRIQFAGKTGHLAVLTLNRRQNDFRMFYVHPKSLLAKQVFEERNSKYIENGWLNKLLFREDGGFVYVSERSGWAQIYTFSALGQVERRVTNGKFDVTALYGMDKQGNIYYQAAAVNPMQREVYRATKNGKTEVLSGTPGTNGAIFSETFAYFIGSHSSANTPDTYTLYNTNKPNKALKVLENNAALNARLAQYQLAKKEFFQVRTADGITLNAMITKPANFDEHKSYPVLMTQYSGPNSQQVLDHYSFGWEYYLASKGVLVITVDGRGTGARGEEWRKCTYMKLGVLESHDQIEAAKALAKLPYVDGSRMGIWGWSFGGYNTLMSLTHGDVFHFGIAVAPVTDWRFYDSIYTERYMRTPQENPDGYRMSSALEAAGNLKGNLLIISGTADDNVHVQNTYDFTELLVQKNILFDMAVYTDKNHGIYGGNTRLQLYRRMVKYLFNQVGISH